MSQPPSDVAPPPATRTCQVNSILDESSNCVPITQMLEDASNDNNEANNKPQFPLGGVLNELQPHQNIQTSP